MQFPESDRDYVARLGAACEFQLRREAQCVREGEFNQAALAADQAEQVSRLAFMVAGDRDSWQ